MRQLVYTMFISNNRAWLCLWWKENLLKHQRVSKYYENDCLQNLLLHFMSLLTTRFVKNCHIWAGIYLIFLKKVLKQIEMLLIPNFDLSKKIGKAVIKWEKIFALFCILIALTLGWNSVRGLRVTKIVNEIKFEGVWSMIESKTVSRHNHSQNIWA